MPIDLTKIPKELQGQLKFIPNADKLEPEELIEKLLENTRESAQKITELGSRKSLGAEEIVQLVSQTMATVMARQQTPAKKPVNVEELVEKLDFSDPDSTKQVFGQLIGVVSQMQNDINTNNAINRERERRDRLSKKLGVDPTEVEKMIYEGIDPNDPDQIYDKTLSIVHGSAQKDKEIAELRAKLEGKATDDYVDSTLKDQKPMINPDYQPKESRKEQQPVSAEDFTAQIQNVFGT